jgi:alpha-tubulin suppressor-like RCC1 family protein
MIVEEEPYKDNLLFLNRDFLVKLSIRSISCGRDHSLLLTSEGIIYSLGSNVCGKLGVGRAFEDLQSASTPIKIDLLANVAMIVTGEDHSLALTRDFKVYGWG